MLHKLTHRCTTPKNLGIIAVSRRTLVCKSIGTKSSVTIVHAATSWSVLRVAGASVLLQLPTARMIQTASSAHAAPTATAHQVATHMAAGALMPTALAGKWRLGRLAARHAVHIFSRLQVYTMANIQSAKTGLNDPKVIEVVPCKHYAVLPA